MNTTLDRKRDSDDFQQGIEEGRRQIQRHFAEWLNSLPKEISSDLVELFQHQSEAEDPKLHAEISQTIREIILPDSLQVEMQAEYDFTHEDPFVRGNLTSYRKKVGEEIKHRRMELRWSQGELADKAGISQSHLCRLETGVHVPTSATIARVAKALGTTPSQLDPGFNDE